MLVKSLGARVAAMALALGGCVQSTRTTWNATERRACAGSTCFHLGELGGDWRPVDEEDGAVGFFSREVGAVIEAKASCRDDADAAPLSMLTNQLLIGYTDRRIRFVERTPLAAREALHAVVDARLDGVPVVLDLYVLKRNGCIFDLSYAAPPDRFPVGRPAFARFVAGFADERSGS